MYWIYLTIFVLAVLVPDIIPGNFIVFNLKEEQLEEILIFFLGLSGFLIFRWKEKQSNANLREKIKIQKETNRMSKSLTDTYSYIGETNRKLDIMKNISMMLLDASDMDQKKEKKFFDTLIESVYILAKSKKIIIRFINTKTKETEREIKSKKRIFLKVSNDDILKKLFNNGKSFNETASYFTIASPKEIDKTISVIIILKNNQQQKLKDPEILKSLASQSLFIYHCLKQN